MQQTVQPFEVIVINDASTDARYTTFDWTSLGSLVRVVHNPVSTRVLYGYPSANYNRLKGVRLAKGDYVCMLDDDDYMMPWYLESNIALLQKTSMKMLCCEAYKGEGPYDASKIYPLYNEECCKDAIRNVHRSKGSSMMENEFPDVFTLMFIFTHNSVITSSVMIKKDLLYEGSIPNCPMVAEDWQIWLNLLRSNDMAYNKRPCVYKNCDTSNRHY